MASKLSRILWGTGLENVLDFGFPFFDRMGDREPRAGSEVTQGPSGVEDAWTVGRDYLLSGRARFVPDADASGISGFSSPAGWGPFLDWAGDKNTFRLVPDVAAPDFFADGCYLVEPLQSPRAGTEPDYRRTVPLLLRHPTVDLERLYRGLMFEYTPGMALTDLPSAVFTRGSTAHFYGVGRTVDLAIANALRDRHYLGGLRTTLLESTRINQFASPRDMANAAWTKTNIPTVGSDALDGPDGLLTADSLVESSDGAPTTHHVAQTLPALTDNFYQASTYVVRPSVRTWALIQAQNKNTSATFYDASFNLATGTIGHVAAGAFATIRELIWKPNTNPAGKYWIITLVWPSGTGSSTPTSRLYLSNATGVAGATYQGNGSTALYVYHAQFEKDVGPSTGGSAVSGFASSIIPVGVTRSPDFLKWSHPFKPQGFFLYTKFVEVGNTQGNGTIRQWRFGGTAAGNVAPFLYITFNATYGTRCDFGAGVVSATNSTVPAAGDVVEMLVTMTAAGVMQVSMALNGGAAVVGAASAANALPSFWADPTFYLHDLGDGHTAYAHVKCGPLVFGGQSVDTIAKARAA